MKELEEKHLSAMEYLVDWALEEIPPLAVIAACDCLGSWLVAVRAHQEESEEANVPEHQAAR